jgi:hypothetical protein
MDTFWIIISGAVVVAAIAIAVFLYKSYESPKTKEKRLSEAKLKREFEEMKQDF